MATEPKEGFLKSGGHRIHYLLWGGSGPKLVFLHSMGMDARGFDTISGALAKEYQVLALDILDHGDSDTPEEPVGLRDHAEIMQDCYRQLGFYPNVLVGHSVGGMMGMVIAAEHPEDLKGLVLVDIAPFEMTGRPSRPPPPEHFADEEEARRYFRERYPGFTPEAVENRVRYALTRDEKGRLKLKPTGDAIRQGLATDLWPYVERMMAPTLMILGSESTLVTEETVKRMKRTLPDLKAVTVRGATHMVPQDKPEEFEGHLRTFLEGLSSG
ncbi:MAG: alpha/beta hydrolase [Candidatus Bathyarchaeota archaeon]|nr:alpha/beta hydrolase [Candidatus Bathyarchaeota archaeon]